MRRCILSKAKINCEYALHQPPCESYKRLIYCSSAALPDKMHHSDSFDQGSCHSLLWADLCFIIVMIGSLY
ncbi:hypothetical protein RSAG8_01481, partial [Rhizoctonia solani AG-8 WAC10335]